MTILEFRVVVIAGLVIANLLIAWVAWKTWRWRHPLIVQIPERNNPAWIGDAANQIIDSNLGTSSHVRSVVDGVRGDTEAMKAETSKLGKIIRRIAEKFGINVDDIDR